MGCYHLLGFANPPAVYPRLIMRVPATTMKADYGIITIKEEEFLAVKSRFKDMRHVRGTRYFRAEVPTSTEKHRTVVLVRCLHQGQGDAQSVAADLIADVDPAWLLLVGIAGAVPAEEFGLGDVLLASRLHDFSVQAAIEGQTPELDVGGGPVHPSVEQLLSIIPGVEEELGPWNALDRLGRPRPALDIPEDITDERYYGKEAWRKRVRGALRSRFRQEPDAHRPCVHIGAVASSNSLVKDTQLVRGWKSVARSITHIEMELGGVYRGAWRRKIVPVLSVRGISDVVGFRRDAEWTNYACETSAAFVQALIASDLPFSGDGPLESEAAPILTFVDLSEKNPTNLPRQLSAVEITWDIIPDDVSQQDPVLLALVAKLASLSENASPRRPYTRVRYIVVLTENEIGALTKASTAGMLAHVGVQRVDLVPVEQVFSHISFLYS